jgi:hypothetical protein
VCALIAAILALVYANSWWQSAKAQQATSNAGRMEPTSKPDGMKPLEDVMNPSGNKPVEEHMNPAGVKDLESVTRNAAVKTPDQLANPKAVKGVEEVTKDATQDVNELTVPNSADQ